MEETKQEFIVRRSVINNMLELLITNYLYNETVQTITVRPLLYQAFQVQLSMFSPNVGESGPGAGWWWSPDHRLWIV